MEYHFDVNSIISIKIIDRRQSSFEFLPKKIVPRFFGLFQPTVYPEGFYDDGEYDGWDPKVYSKEKLEGYGYIVDKDNTVWYRPYATVYLAHTYSITKEFFTLEEAREWVEELKKISGKTFEIIKY